MSAPFLWVIFPILASIILFIFHKWERWVHLAGTLIVIVLTILAFQLPIGEAIPNRFWAGFPSFFIRESIPVLSARITIDGAFRPIIILVYLMTAYWFTGAYACKISSFFIPIGLAFSGLICLALSITPDIYAPFFLEIAVLISIPLLASPGKSALHGVRRFLTFQTLGMALILLANWTILYAALQSGMQIDLLIPIILLGLGFALALPIFPFHAWLPLQSGESPPFSTSLIFFLLPFAFFMLILQSLIGLSLSSYINEMIRLLRLGAVSLMILGGAGAALEKNLGRTMGYAIIHHIGVSLLGISLIEYSRNYLPNSVPFFYFFIPWGISLGLLALSINILHKKHDYVEISDLNGIIRRSPWISAGILISIFSMGGLPLLAGFPAYIGIWSPLVQRDPRLALVAWLGNALIILTGLNLFSIMIRTSNPQENWRISESVVQISILTAGILVILILGLLPTGPFIVWANHAAMLMFSAP